MWCRKQAYKSYKEMTMEYKDEIHLNDEYIQLNYIYILFVNSLIFLC